MFQERFGGIGLQREGKYDMEGGSKQILKARKRKLRQIFISLFVPKWHLCTVLCSVAPDVRIRACAKLW